jgi:hypothetical protein
MQCRDLILDGLSRIDEGIRQQVAGLSSAELAFRPSASANPIGWIAWHLTRVEDSHLAELAGRPQAWIADGWHQKFGRAADPNDTGYGQTAEEVGAFVSPSPDVLVAYFEAVHEQSVAYVKTLNDDDFDVVVDRAWDPPVTAGVRLISVVDDCAQHMGQIGYVRGLAQEAR